MISTAVHKIDFQRSSQNNEIMSRMGRYQHTLYQHTLYHNKLLEYIHEPSSIKIAGSLIHVGSLHLCRLQRSLFSYTVSSTQLSNRAVFKAVYTSVSKKHTQSSRYNISSKHYSSRSITQAAGSLHAGSPLITHSQLHAVCHHSDNKWTLISKDFHFNAMDASH